MTFFVLNHDIVLQLNFMGSTLDVNECELQPGLCRNGTCDNKVGGYNCNCAPGFTLTVNDDCEGRKFNLLGI